tara:strand:+ start:850 stop:3006 length:2157 start_codon:yes stop_codon:yes gene_type:complete
MADWYVISNTFDAVGGTAEAGQTVELEITAMNPDSTAANDWSGAFIKKENFKIGGATESPTNTWTGGNVDTPVSKVVFTDNPVDGSLVGTPFNKVKATVHLNSFTPSSASTIYVDIDEQDLAPVFNGSHDFVLETTVELTDDSLSSNHTVTNVNLTDITETTVTAGSVFRNSASFLYGSATNVIQEITFVADTGYFYEYVPSSFVFTFGSVLPGNINNLLYVASVLDESITVNSSNQITAFTVTVFANVLPFLMGFIDDFTINDGHKLNFEVPLTAIEVTATDIVTEVEVPSEVPSDGGNFEITITGQPGSVGTVNLFKTASLTDGTIKTPFASDLLELRFSEYDFENQVFTAFDGASFGLPDIKFQDRTGDQFTLDENGKATKEFKLDPIYYENTAGTAQRYDLIIEDRGSQKKGKITKINASRKSIIQRGLLTGTISLSTLESSNFATLPSNITFTRPEKIAGDVRGQQTNSYIIHRGGTGGVSSTRLTLNTANENILPGMLITGSGIPHGTTVSSVTNNSITLSSASTVENDTRLRFERNAVDVVPFSFTVSPAPGKVLSVQDSTHLKVGGVNSGDLKRFLQGSVSNSTTVNLLDGIGIITGLSFLTVQPFTTGYHGTRGIAPGMIVKDPADGTIVGTVASITDVNTFEMEAAGSVSSASSEIIIEPANPHVTLINIQTSKVGNDIVISGNLKVRELEKSSTFPIYIDSLITTHN